MANPTSNFNWQMPTNTDLVKDLPADFEVFGQAVDTSLADLKGGTSGQILSKNSNTDMDFVWINNDQGDITAVNVTSPITGGGSAGAVTVGIQDGTTAQKGAVQLENSTSSTSTTTAAVPASVKSAYDLANAAIAKSLVDAEGDLIVGDAADAVQRLAIGTTGQVLTVDTAVDGKIKWATPSSGSTFVGCSIRKTATTTSISNATYTAFTCDTEDYDTDGFHDNSTNNSRITIPSGKGGYYQISGKIAFAANSSGIRVAGIYKNGSLVGGFTTPSISGSSINYPFLVTMNLAVGDYVELYVYQDSGGALNLFSGYTPPEYSYLQAVYLGA